MPVKALIFVSVLSVSLFAIADEPASCPATVDVQQHLSTPVPGWSSMYDDSPHQLAAVTFYDGPPQEKASLVYGDISKAAGKQIAKWTFAPHSARPTWITCSYSGTTAILTKALPPTVTGCAVTYDARQQIAGCRRS